MYEKDFINKIIEEGKIKLFILTGLFVNNSNSIVDLFIVGRLHKDKFLKTIKKLESELGREINYTILSHKEYLFRRDMTDVFLYNILEGNKIIVIDEYGIS